MTNFEGVDRVIENPLNFKNKLGLGEGALAPTALLATLGLSASAAPIGWVIAAGVASGAGFLGISQFLGSGRGEGLDVVPKWINTPLDAMAVALFNFLVPLGLKVAALDDKIHESERRYIINYLVDEWGYSEQFVQSELPKLECNVETFPTVEVVNSLIEYKKSNPNCNFESMANELTGFLKEVTKANGELHDQEVIFIQWLEITLAHGKLRDKLVSDVGFSRKSKMKMRGNDELAVNFASDKNVPNSNGDRGGEDRNARNGDGVQDKEDGNKSSQEGGASDSTLIGRYFRSALRWTKDQV